MTSFYHETERLILRSWKNEDRQSFADLFNDCVGESSFSTSHVENWND